MILNCMLMTFAGLAGGEGTLADFHDARPALAEAAAGPAAAGGAPKAFDYLLACRYDTASDGLLVAAGSNAGGCALFAVREPSGDMPAALGPTSATLAGSHSDVMPRSPHFFIARPLHLRIFLRRMELALMCLIVGSANTCSMHRVVRCAGFGCAGDLNKACRLMLTHHVNRLSEALRGYQMDQSQLAARMANCVFGRGAVMA